MRQSKTYFLTALILFACNYTLAKRNGFAIVIDPLSQERAKAELDDYINTLETKQGFKVYIVTDKWGIPDSIRAELKRLYNLPHSPIAGAVFIGDIPIAMIRDAQHLTSAFKMNQQSPWEESSVPSDRYYDDFSLEFELLKRDSTNAFHYYSLSAEGAQKLSPNIFSGRIRTTDGNIPNSRYKKLKAYLKKATEAKRHPEHVSSVFVYTGSGSLSESKIAHMDEMRNMHNHFPTLAHKPDAFRYMDFSDQRVIKTQFMNALMSADLSIAFMHHHGDYDTQYLSEYPKPENMDEAKEYLLHCFRTYIHRKKIFGYDADSVRNILQKKYQLPTQWLSELDDKSIAKDDSMLKAMTNLVTEDFNVYGFRPNCRVAFWDACYNGSWHRENNIANEYLFQPGKTICGIGASVNVIQDKYSDRFVGLLAYGVMVGLLNQLNPNLEMHVVGDPTFVFTSEYKTDLNNLIINGKAKDWKKLNEPRHCPDIQALAINKLDQYGYLSDDELIDYLKTSKHDAVRTEVFLILQKRNTDKFISAIKIAADDNYEFLQRLAINNVSKLGSESLARILAKKICSVNTSARIAFNAIHSVQFFSKKDFMPVLEEEINKTRPYRTEPENFAKTITENCNEYAGRWDRRIQELCNGKMTMQQALTQIGFMRIYCPPYLLGKVTEYVSHLENNELLLPLLEAIGWHRLAFNSKEVLPVVKKISEDSSRPENIRKEALKTYKRLK